MHPRAKFRAACIQVNASNDMAANIKAASDFARAAVRDGAQLVLMPENVSMIEAGRANIIAKAMPEETHAALAAFRALAAELGMPRASRASACAAEEEPSESSKDATSAGAC